MLSKQSKEKDPEMAMRIITDAKWKIPFFKTVFFRTFSVNQWQQRYRIL